MALLTDRSLYRPGQTVHVKGIAYKQNSDSAQVLQGVDYELVLLDANRKELENVRVGNEIIMQNIVHPLEVQVKRLNTNVSRLEKAVGKISLCPHAADCPVSHELRKHKECDDPEHDDK